MGALYKHPDGHEINLTRGFLTITNADCDDSVSVPIGQIGLRELGERLITLSACKFTAADCAEQAGAVMGNSLLNDMMHAGTQAEKVRLIQAAVLDLATLQHHDRAAGGFGMMMVNVLEIGLQNLPKVAQ